MTEETRAIVEGLTQAFKEYVEERLEGFESIAKTQSPIPDIDAQIGQIISTHFSDTIREPEFREWQHQLENLERSTKARVDGLQQQVVELTNQLEQKSSHSTTQNEQTSGYARVKETLASTYPMVETTLIELIAEKAWQVTGQNPDQTILLIEQSVKDVLVEKNIPDNDTNAIAEILTALAEGRPPKIRKRRNSN